MRTNFKIIFLNKKKNICKFHEQYTDPLKNVGHAKPRILVTIQTFT